jgi:hypothetical protein
LILPAKSLADGARPAYRKEIGDGSIAVQFASYNSKIDNRLLIMPACKMHALVRILVAQPRSVVSGLYFPQDGKASMFPQVRLSGTGLSSAISGISLLWTRVSGAGLCSLFSNFRFQGGETGSTVARDRFEERP